MARVGAGLVVSAVLAVAGMASPATAQPACARSDFEAVVNEVAVALRELNQSNRPALQQKLRLLKEKRGWSQDEFLKLAAPLVQDERIAAFDKETNVQLDRINGLGAGAATAAAPDCAVLADLKQQMSQLLALQRERWTYMYQRIDAELAR